MKMRSIVIFLLMIFFCQGCKKEVSQKKPALNKNSIIKSDSIITKLTTFYKHYFAEMENTGKNSEENLNVLKKKYMSPQLFEKLKTIDLDYDPVINGQDVYSNWRNSLKITHIKNNEYEMCVKSGFDNSQYCSFLQVGKIQGKNMILDIRVNGISSILNFSKTSETANNAINNPLNVTGKWQLYCDSDTSSIEFYDETSASMDFRTKSDLLARINLKVVKANETFQLFFDGLTGVTKGNTDLNWESLSKNQAISEVSVSNDKLKFQWLGFYNNKKKQKEQLSNPFNKGENQIFLSKCTE